jgi:hypothetical protein
MEHEMPKIPTPAAQLSDGAYLFKITSCVTNAGKYGKQEELSLTILDDKGDDTTGHLKFWIGHDSVKAFDMCRKGGILLVDTESNEWQVKVNCIFNGIIQAGKIVLITRA